MRESTAGRSRAEREIRERKLPLPPLPLPYFWGAGEKNHPSGADSYDRRSITEGKTTPNVAGNGRALRRVGGGSGGG